MVCLCVQAAVDTTSFLSILFSNYDGGMFKVQMVFHDTFPDIQPRVKFLTPMYHIHVTSDGVPFYTVEKPEDVRSHIEAISRLALEDEPSTNPSTHVNLDVSGQS